MDLREASLLTHILSGLYCTDLRFNTNNGKHHAADGEVADRATGYQPKMQEKRNIHSNLVIGLNLMSVYS